jgi:hypothetical protein
VNQELIQTWWPNAQATEIELVNNSLGVPEPKFESDGWLRYKLGFNHPSQLFWQCPSLYQMQPSNSNLGALH